MLRTGRCLLVLLILCASKAVLAAVDEVEPNDSALQAQDVSGAATDLADGYLPSGAGVLVRGQIVPGDVDYLAFGLRSGQLVTVTAYGDDGGAFDDPALGLFDPGDLLVASDDDAGQGLLPSLVHVATQDGLYRVALTGFQDTAFDGSEHGESFDYELAISVTTAPPGFPELDDLGNDAPAGAEPLPPGAGPFATRAPGSVSVISGCRMTSCGCFIGSGPHSAAPALPRTRRSCRVPGGRRCCPTSGAGAHRHAAGSRCPAR